MASRRGVDACIFCGEIPCACNKTSKKPKQAKSRPSNSAVMEQPNKPATSARSAMKSAAVAWKPEPIPEPPAPPKKEVNEEQAVWMTAIRNLAPLLHPDELEELSVILNTPSTPEERAAAWRVRRKAG